MNASSNARRAGPLTVEEERALARRWKSVEDRKALTRMVESHLGLVIRIAMEFRNSGPAMEDLIQEGNVGLTIAARRFDPDKATRLATYATYWIRAMMLEHIVRSHGPVRIGTTRSQRKIFFGLGRARRKLEVGGGTVATSDLAQILGVKEEEVESMLPRLASRDLSFDVPPTVNDSRSISSFLKDDAPSVEDLLSEVVEVHNERRLLRKAVDALDPRERAIMKARHLRDQPVTLAALGQKFGLSRERVRQLELRAKEKVRRRCLNK